jgi:type IV pilus assembly protein PilZ
MMAGEPSHSRDHARHPIELKVEYKRLNAFFADYTKNISKGGTFIRTDKPLDVGTEFIFELHVPRVSEPLRITGQVQWVLTQEEVDAAPGTGPGAPGMGIRFVYRDDTQRAEIERQIEKIMVDSLGQRLYSRLMEHSRSEAMQGEESALADALGGLGVLSPGGREQ